MFSFSEEDIARSGNAFDPTTLHLSMPNISTFTVNSSDLHSTTMSTTSTTTSTMADNEVDEDLYNRQIYVMGLEAQKKMAGSNVLLLGLNGLGVEVAKNVILAGVKQLTLCDPAPATFEDLSSQFYLTEEDVARGSGRAAASVAKLAELNPYVQVNTIPEFTLDAVKAYGVVVLIDVPGSDQLAIANHCHELGIAVIVADARGVFGQVFCDFGNAFVVNDTNGEPTTTSMVAGVICDAATSRAHITVLEETRHNLETGDSVLLTQIGGMDFLNNKHFSVTVKDAFTFEITVPVEPAADGSVPTYGGGGYVAQIKQQATISFDSMGETIDKPGEFACDWNKMHRAGVSHQMFRGLHAFRARNGGALPEAGNVAHAQAVYDLTVELNSGSQQVASPADISDHEDLIKRFALSARGNLSPMAAFLGGVVGQEVLKACSGKFMPIRQWFYYDFIEALPTAILPQSEVSPVGCRNDGQIAVFGKEMQAKLESLKMFLVGAGAIGCEMLKNWAMMGIASDRSGAGNIIVTDPDQIEKSNLSRQFLFRHGDIHHPKSTSAAGAIKGMNPATRVTAYETKVCPDTESFFNDDFFESLDMVCTALDNVEARLYVDQRCLFYHKPMLESGTLGTKGNTQVVLPFKTEHYGASRDPQEKSIPMCTVKFFPNQIEHTIQWAREWFEEIYKQTPSDAMDYINNANFLSSLAQQQNMKLETLVHVRDSLLDGPRSLEDCIVWARLKFEDMFTNQINQLLYNFPLDKMTSEGTLYWSGAKKAPSAIIFDASDPLHMEFVMSAANLRASVFGLPTDWSPERFLSVLPHIVVPIFRPQDGVKIPQSDEEAKSNNAPTPVAAADVDIDEVCRDIIRGLPPRDIGTSLHPVDFDKDINAQMLVVSSVANIRARNYRIPEVDLHKARGIAGKIIPAIATTTALVTGSICMELYKILLDKPVDSFFNSFYNLAIPIYTTMNPEPPKSNTSVVSQKEWKWNQWDRIDIGNPSLTLAQLIKHFEEEYGLDVVMLSAGVTILFSSMLPKKKLEERKAMTMAQLYSSLSKKEVPPSQKYITLEMIFEDIDSGNEVELPYVRFQLH